MFDSFASRQSLTAKALTLSAIGMAVGFGTCGLGALTASNQGRISQFAVYAGATLFFISLAALLITVLVALAIQIARLFRS